MPGQRQSSVGLGESSKSAPGDAESPQSNSRENARERKRIQNRLAQRLFREKQVSYIQHLERSLEIATQVRSPSSPTSPSTTGDNAAPDGGIVQLLQENLELREALLRMRRNVMMLEKSASSCANDPIFDKLSMSSHSSNSGTSRTSFSAQSPAAPLDIQHAEMYLSPPADSPISANDPATNRPEVDAMSQMRISSIVSDSPKMEYPRSIGATLTESNLRASHWPPLTSPNRLSPTATRGHFPPGIMEDTNESLEVDVIRVMLEGERLAKEVIAMMSMGSFRQRSVNPETRKSETFTEGFAKMASDLEFEEDSQLDQLTVIDVARAVYRLVNRAQKIDKIVYGMGLHETLEKVFLWRVQPTEANRRAIPHPLTPTSIQIAYPNRAPPIDYTPWPTIRDQLCLKSGSFNLRDFMRDMMPNLVVEVPELRACYRFLEEQVSLLELWAKNPGTGPQNFNHESHPDTLSNRWDYKLLPSVAARYPMLEINDRITHFSLVPFHVVKAHRQSTKERRP